MEALIQNLQYADKTVQAIAVSVGGLIGVFATLASFFIVMIIAVKFSKAKEG